MKTKHRILSVLTILALVASLAAVMVAPVGAITAFAVPAITDRAAEATGVTYEISFIPGDTVEAEDVITITFPDDTSLGAIDPDGPDGTLGALGRADDGVFVDGDPADNVPDIAPRPSLDLAHIVDEMLIISLDIDVPAGAPIRIDIRGVTNTAIPGRYRLRVRTTDEPTDVESGAFIITGFALDPVSGAVGDTVTAVGAGFIANQSVWIYHDGNINNMLDTGETIFATTTTDGHGVFIVEFEVTSALEQVMGEIDARDGAGTNKDGPAFDVDATISLDTLTVPRGGIVQFDGVNFIPGALTDIYMRFDAVGTGFTDTENNLVLNATSFSNATIQMPFGAPWGTQLVTARVRAEEDSATIQVVESLLSLDPIMGPAGQMVTVTGSNLAASWLYGVWFDTDHDAAPVAGEILETARTDTEGNLSLTFVVPDGADPGVALRVALIADSDDDETVETGDIRVALADFTIPAAAITLSPTDGLPGIMVTVTGTGFAAFSTLAALHIDDAEVTPIPSVITDAAGNFVATFIVPGLGAGTFDVLADVGAALNVDAEFEIIAVAVPVVSALRTIEGQFTIVWGFDAEAQEWRFFDPAAPQVSDLETLVRGMGYWIYVTQDATIIHGGNVYRLDEGWNLIGWLG